MPNNLGNALPTTPERKHLFLLEVFPLENIKYFNETVQRQIISKSLQSCRFLALLGIAVTTVKIAFVVALILEKAGRCLFSYDIRKRPPSLKSYILVTGMVLEGGLPGLPALLLASATVTSGKN